MLLAAAEHEARGLRRQPEQMPDRGAGAMAGSQLEHLAQEHEHGDDDAGVEIGVDGAVHPEAVREQTGRCRRDGAVPERRTE